MRSVWGIEHGEIEKGLPSAVKAGGGGSYGALLRSKKQMGFLGAKHSNTRRITTISGKGFKEQAESRKTSARVAQSLRGEASRSKRAGLLNEDSAARRKGFKTGKTSALDRGYRGRVSYPMTKLP